MATPTATYPAVPTRRLPIGVAIVSILIGIVGGLLLVGAILLLLFAGSAYFAHSLAIFGGGLIGGLILLGLSILLLVVASGLWHLELWALVLSIIVVALLFIGYVLAGAIVSVGGILSLVLLIYLIAVHRHFR